MPADLDGSNQPPTGAPNPFTEIGTNPTWKLWRFHADFVNPSNSTFTQAGTLTPGAVQRRSRRWLRAAGRHRRHARHARRPEHVPERLPSLRRRPRGARREHDASTRTASEGIRWYEINNATSGTPSFVQQSTYQPDTTWRWMGSAAMDALGDIAVGFSASSSSINPQIRYAGRLASDPPNTLAQGETTLFAGTGSQTDTLGRWGDYSDLTVDPNDDCTFWYTNEYYATTSSFNWQHPNRELQVPELHRRAARHPDRQGHGRQQQQPDRGRQGRHELRSAPSTDANGNYTLTLPAGTYTRHLLGVRLRDATSRTASQITDGGHDDEERGAHAVALGDAERKRDRRVWSRLAAVRPNRRRRQAGRAGLHRSDHRPLQLQAAGERELRRDVSPRSCRATRSSTRRSPVGGTDTTHNVADAGDARLHRARLHAGRTALSEQFDERARFPPPGWSVTDHVGATARSGSSTTPRASRTTTGGTGNFADINSDFYGGGATQDTSLVTPTLNLSAAARAVPDVPQQLHRLAGVPADRRRGREHGRWHHVDERLAPRRATPVPGPGLETVQLPTGRQPGQRRRCASTSPRRSASGGWSTTSRC